MDQETQEKIKELQIYEQNFQILLMQKQTLQVELTEVKNALSEIKNTKEDIFKVIGQIMIKTNKEKTEKELQQKQEMLLLRLKSIEKQETGITKELEILRKDIMKKI